MKRFPKLIAGVSLIALSACADLGYGENSLSSLVDGTPGPVQIAELQMAVPDPSVAGPQAAMVKDVPGFEPPIPAIARTPLAAPETVTPATPKPSLSTPTMMSLVAPANAPRGQCFAEFVTPAVTTSSSKQVLVSPATTKTETIPAKYETETVRELVTEATTRTETIPATFKTEIRRVPVEGSETVAVTVEGQTKTITEEVLVKPAEVRTIDVPAVYETVTERVKTADSYTEWRESTKVYAIGAEALGGTILANRVSSSSIMCLVEIPAEYQTVTKRVLVSEATTREEVIPAEYETVTKEVPVDSNATESTASADGAFKEVEVQVVDTPEQVRVVPVPAEYKTVTKRVLVSPAVTRTVPVKPVYRNEVTTTIVTPAKREMVAVLCDNEATPDFVKSMQIALKERTLYEGPIDGIIGSKTRRAIRIYQNGRSDMLSVAAAKDLGLNL